MTPSAGAPFHLLERLGAARVRADRAHARRAGNAGHGESCCMARPGAARRRCRMGCAERRGVQPPDVRRRTECRARPRPAARCRRSGLARDARARALPLPSGAATQRATEDVAAALTRLPQAPREIVPALRTVATSGCAVGIRSRAGRCCEGASGRAGRRGAPPHACAAALRDAVGETGARVRGVRRRPVVMTMMARGASPTSPCASAWRRPDRAYPRRCAHRPAASAGRWSS